MILLLEMLQLFYPRRCFTIFYNLPKNFIHEFKPHWLIKSPLLQGLISKYVNVPHIKWKSVYLKFKDEVTCKLDYVEPTVPPKGTILIFHGYGGSSSSNYCKDIAYHFGNSYKVIVYNRRAHVDESKSIKLPTHYDKDDIEVVMNYIQTQACQTPIYGVGFSNGANMIMRYVGESGKDCIFNKVFTCGNGWDYNHATQNIKSDWANKLLCKMSKSIFRNVEGALSKYDIHTNFRQQEIHTFADNDENQLINYYKNISAIHVFDNIAVPCLCMDALDDILYFYHDTKSIVNKNPMVSFIFTSHGGHIGWVDNLWGDKYYISVLKNWI